MVNEVSGALSIQNLSFRYKGQADLCIRDLSLDVPMAHRFGLLGPNGAGKTTLMHLLTGLLPALNGTVHFFGKQIARKENKVRRLFGFVPQDFSFYPELSPLENLDFFGAWYGLSRQEIKRRSEELLEILGLEDVANKAVKKFSGGMKRRVNLAIGVIHQPPLLFLDEPTVGVDVQTRKAIINYLISLNKEGTTIFYTSHQLKEAEELCQSIALIDEGSVLVSGKLDDLLTADQDLESLFLSLTGKEFRD